MEIGIKLWQNQYCEKTEKLKLWNKKNFKKNPTLTTQTQFTKKFKKSNPDKTKKK